MFVSVKYYSKFPEVPDFGATYNVPLYCNYEGLFCYRSSYVEEDDLTGYSILYS